ncbi:hypothetical protein HBDW_04700 [Herbaspirillum sp. DW155]|uniref:hypothetical protein n=1 Tax=Herbaspirillum sp. DW155 TaxID=3095609 RepID=UPI003092B815|nr:hypothetical protein HBDW_04700 [Herbaspirillum sp. DW155]
MDIELIESNVSRQADYIKLYPACFSQAIKFQHGCPMYDRCGFYRQGSVFRQARPFIRTHFDNSGSAP